MALRKLNRLQSMQVDRLKADGKYADGGNLFLVITGCGQFRKWVFRYKSPTACTERNMGLGATHTVPLQRARELAAEARGIIASGGDPLDIRQAERAAAQAAHAKRMTFSQCAGRYIAANKAGWRNVKHADQWTATLATYAEPINSLMVDVIDTAHVLKCIEPIWTEKAETATRVRGRIESVLDWATARKLRTGENPARWKGHLDKLLPKRSKVQKVEHRAALPYADIHAFMIELRQRHGLAARALELQILTATRPGEATGAQWNEFDLDAAVWTIPGERMKANIEHSIPLAPRAVELMRALPRIDSNVFPGRQGRPLTTAAGMKALKELRPGMTAHGFRSSFRDWAGETTAHPREVIEHAMAHRIPDKSEAAYARGAMFTKRTRLMDDWAKYCDTPKASGNVTPIKKIPAKVG